MPDPDTIPPHGSSRRLLEAIHAGDADGVAALLAPDGTLRAALDGPIEGGHFGSTALLEAVQRGDRAVVDALLRAGADINARSHWWAGGFGVLDSGHALVDFLLARGARLDAHAAARLGRMDALRALVAADPGVVASRGGDGQTPLHFACSEEIAGFLLDHGADPDATDVDHESTPAQWMMRDRRGVARFLVARGCRVDLLMASALGDLGHARRLLDEDPSRIRTAVNHAWFPMRDPRAGGHIYQWTLGTNKTPHALARESGHDAVLGLLLERSPDDVLLAVAPVLGDAALLRRMVASLPGFPATLAPAHRHALVDAAMERDAAAVRLMLEAGWPVDCLGRHGATALHWAAFHGDAALATLILGFRPPLELPDHDFKATPMGWAMHGSLEGWHREIGDYPGVARALLAAGARVPSGRRASPAVEAVLAGKA